VAKREKPIIITGKAGTGKTTKALEMFENTPTILYANEVDYLDIFSIPTDVGFLIEDVHYKPKTDNIMRIINNYKGQIVLTSMNEKDIPAKIKNACKKKRAGTKTLLQDSIKELAPHSDEPKNYDISVFDIVNQYLRSKNRDDIRELLLLKRPPDTQILTWLNENIHPNKISWIDHSVKRKWSSDYFYSLLAYTHSGEHYTRLQFPKRRSYSEIPKICRRLGLKKEESYLLSQLFKDEEFKEWAKKKLDNSQCRLLGLGEKKRRKKTTPIVAEVSLNEW
tara:strand:+ start:2857 stop:3693 length:837 start_codon:yes stop_codon:yes gene_type:complete